jgi:hypothetical protein
MILALLFFCMTDTSEMKVCNSPNLNNKVSAFKQLKSSNFDNFYLYGFSKDSIPFKEIDKHIIIFGNSRSCNQCFFSLFDYLHKNKLDSNSILVISSSSKNINKRDWFDKFSKVLPSFKGKIYFDHSNYNHSNYLSEGIMPFLEISNTPCLLIKQKEKYTYYPYNCLFNPDLTIKPEIKKELE